MEILSCFLQTKIIRSQNQAVRNITKFDFLKKITFWLLVRIKQFICQFVDIFSFETIKFIQISSKIFPYFVQKKSYVSPKPIGQKISRISTFWHITFRINYILIYYQEDWIIFTSRSLINKIYTLSITTLINLLPAATINLHITRLVNLACISLDDLQ